jgi:hypothetical protein
VRETPTAIITLGDDGTVRVRIRSGSHQTIADAQENLRAALAVTDGRRRPLLVDITGARPLDAEVRHYYSGQVLVDGFSALALLIESSPLGSMMGNVYLRVARPGIPTRLFTSEHKAVSWLATHRE